MAPSQYPQACRGTLRRLPATICGIPDPSAVTCISRLIEIGRGLAASPPDHQAYGSRTMAVRLITAEKGMTLKFQISSMPVGIPLPSPFLFHVEPNISPAHVKCSFSSPHSPLPLLYPPHQFNSSILHYKFKIF
jgi:hypothetical protein